MCLCPMDTEKTCAPAKFLPFTGRCRDDSHAETLARSTQFFSRGSALCAHVPAGRKKRRARGQDEPLTEMDMDMQLDPGSPELDPLTGMPTHNESGRQFWHG